VPTEKSGGVKYGLPPLSETAVSVYPVGGLTLVDKVGLVLAGLAVASDPAINVNVAEILTPATNFGCLLSFGQSQLCETAVRLYFGGFGGLPLRFTIRIMLPLSTAIPVTGKPNADSDCNNDQQCN